MTIKLMLVIGYFAVCSLVASTYVDKFFADFKDKGLPFCIVTFTITFLIGPILFVYYLITYAINYFREKRKKKDPPVEQVLIFTAMKKLNVDYYEAFRFTNQKTDDIYYFSKVALMKLSRGEEKRSRASLNWICDPECKIVKLSPNEILFHGVKYNTKMSGDK